MVSSYLVSPLLSHSMISSAPPITHFLNRPLLVGSILVGIPYLPKVESDPLIACDHVALVNLSLLYPLHLVINL